MSIKFFDMFSGIGGFRSGLEALDGYEYISCLYVITSTAVKSRHRWNPSSTEREKYSRQMNLRLRPTQDVGKASLHIPMCIRKAAQNLQSTLPLLETR